MEIEVYNVWDKRELVFTGTIKEIADNYGYSVPKINEIINKGNLIKGIYKITNKKIVEDYEEESLYSYIKKHLVNYGYKNTITMQDPTEEIA